MKLIKESLFEFEKPKNIKQAADIGIGSLIKRDMRTDGYQVKIDDYQLMINWCAEHNKVQYIKYLLSLNVKYDINKALMKAAMKNSYDVFVILLNHTNNLGKFGNAILNILITKKYYDILILFLSKVKININMDDWQYINKIIFSEDIKIINKVYEYIKKENLKLYHSFLNKGLIISCKLNDKYEESKYFIDKGANINNIDKNPLGIATLYSQTEVAILLIDNGANIHINNDYALRWAARKNNLTLLKYLIEHGANIHAKNDEALYLSVHYNNVDIVKYLIKKGANIHARNDEILKMNKSNDMLKIFDIYNGINIK